MTRRINAEALAKLKQWEGFKPYAYDDADGKRVMPGQKIAGTLTIGYGHTGADVKPGMLIDEQHAHNLLLGDLARFEERVERLVKVDLTDNQFAALVSFDFNTGALDKSTLLKELNKGFYERVPYELARWNKATVKGKKVVVKGLVNRRAVESALWASGDFVSSNTVPVAAPSKPILTQETATWGAGILATLGSLFNGDGPVQWALGTVIVLTFTVGGYLFLKKRLKVG